MYTAVGLLFFLIYWNEAGANEVVPLEKQGPECTEEQKRTISEGVENATKFFTDTPVFIENKEFKRMLTWYDAIPPSTDLSGQIPVQYLQYVYHGTLNWPIRVGVRLIPPGSQVFIMHYYNDCEDILPMQRRHWLQWLQENV